MKHREANFKNQLVCLLPRIWRFGMSLSGNKDACNDLVQATCERALTHYHQWKPGTRLDRWVFSIMYSVWMNELRAQSIRRGNGFVDPESSQFEQTGASQETQLYADEVVRTVNSLPEAQRSAIMLVYVEGYTYREAADILKVPIGTIMSRLARARNELGERLRRPATRKKSLELI